MSNLPKKCVVDTNVPITANLQPAKIPDDFLDCVLNCIEAIEHVVNEGGLILDAGDEIFDEYRKQLSLSGQPGVGDSFIKWVHDHRYNSQDVELVPISKTGNTYEEFPDNADLKTFDISDRKFVAVANAHHNKPSIFEATDSKWWGWKDALAEVGLTVKFLCPDYVKAKYYNRLKT